MSELKLNRVCNHGLPWPIEYRCAACDANEILQLKLAVKALSVGRTDEETKLLNEFVKTMDNTMTIILKKENDCLHEKLKIAEEALEKVENTMSEVNGHCGCEYNRFGDPCEHEIARDALPKIRESSK